VSLRCRAKPVGNLSRPNHAESFASEAFEVTIVVLQLPDMLLHSLVVLLQLKRHLFERSLVLSQPLQVTKTMFPVNCKCDQRDQAGESDCEGGFVFAWERR
jgi:hypothetical protein